MISKLNQRIGITFQESNNKIIASISVNELEKTPENISRLLNEATGIYLEYIKELKQIVATNNELRSQKKEVPA